MDNGTHDNENVVVLPEELFIKVTDALTMKLAILGTQEQHQEWMKVQKGVALEEDKWTNQGQLVIAPEDDLQRSILQQYHDHEAAGHLGIANTLVAVGWDYWWPTMKDFITKYVKGCTTCQATKPNMTKPKIPLQPIMPHVEAVPFQMISLDLITDLPMVQGQDAILTIVDHGCSRAALFLPCQTTSTGEDLATLYYQHVIPWFGVPHKLIMDRDPQFTSNFTRALCQQLGIQQNISMAYHPQTDGLSERKNQ